MQHCEEHTDFLEKITESTTCIENMHETILGLREDVKATRQEVSDAVKKAEEQLVTNTQDIAVMQERWRNAKWVIAGVVTVVTGIVIKIISDFLTR